MRICLTKKHVLFGRLVPYNLHRRFVNEIRTEISWVVATLPNIYIFYGINMGVFKVHEGLPSLTYYTCETMVTGELVLGC